jgi:hypothetical protein
MRTRFPKLVAVAAAVALCATVLIPLGASAAGTWLAATQMPIYSPSPNYGTVASTGYPQPLTCWQNGNWNYKNPGYPICNGQTIVAFLSAHPQGSTASGITQVTNVQGGILKIFGMGGGPTYSQANAGSVPTVATGTPISLEWSCQPSTGSEYANQPNSHGAIGVYSGGGTYYFQNGVSSSNFGASGTLGSVTVNAPTTPGTKTYMVTCNGSAGSQTMSVSVTASGPPPPPPSCADGLDYPTYGPSCACPSGKVQSGTQCIAEASIGSFTTSTTTPNSGDPVVLSWTSSFTDASCRLGGGSLGTVTNNGTLSGGTAVPGTGSLSSGPVSAQTTYSLECSQNYGNTNDFAQKQVTVTPTSATGQLTPNPTTVQLNGLGAGSSYIQWYVANADQCQISGDGMVTQQYLGSACSGWHYPLAAYNAPGTYNYQLQWYTPGAGWQSANAAVTVKALTPPSLSCLPSTVSPAGADTVCTWSASATNYTSCVGSGPGFTTGGAISGTKQVSVPNTTTYSVNCTGASGSSSASQPVTVQSPHVTSLLSANPTRVQKGGSTVLSWQSVGMSSCSVTGPLGVVATLTGASVPVTQATTFNLSCLDAANNTYPGGSVTVGIVPIYTEH